MNSKIKELIENVSESDKLTEQRLGWLVGGTNHGLDEAGLSDIVRFLLKRITSKINDTYFFQKLSFGICLFL